jgi:2-iminobutanoate/2-iminopropanoate deaminase
VTVRRYNPDVGYVNPEDFHEFGLTQVVEANGFLFISGIAPVRGRLADYEIVAPFDLEAQLRFELEVLDGCLSARGSTRQDVVSWNLYVTDFDALTRVGHVTREWSGDQLPASTAVEVKRLFVPEQMIELQAVAIARTAAREPMQ